jgi:peptide-methionine (S)-S-oxide reductase
MFFIRKSNSLSNNPLKGRLEPIETQKNHTVSGRSLHPPFPENMQVIYLAMGCFWGVEKLFWNQEGVYVTAVGYGGGDTQNPTYNEVCSGQTNHTEVVMVVYDPQVISTQKIMKLFWENHDPTQGMRQGNDMGTQYRSAIYTTNDEQFKSAMDTKDSYQKALSSAGSKDISTEIKPFEAFYYAEADHQQYLAKNPMGYCNMKGTGVCLL